jgi:hypothetical protein
VGGKRQQQEAIPKIASRFSRSLRATSGQIIQKLAEERVPLRQVYEGHVYAAFDLLEASIRQQRIFSGSMPKAFPMTAADSAKDVEVVMQEILDIISEELEYVDRRHEYSILIVKRERGSKTIL